MVDATYDVAVDLDGSELFTETGETLTSVVSTSPPGERGGRLIAVSRGRDVQRMLMPPRAGDLRMTVDNKSGSYGPSSTLQAGRAVRFRATYSGTTYELYRAALDRPEHLPGTAFEKLVALDSLGPLSRLPGRRVSTALHSSIRTDEALAYVLDAAGWPKNAQGYVTDLAPALQLGMSGAAGTETDRSGNGNDATVTYAAGQRGAAALDDGGDGATTFERGTTNVTWTPPAAKTGWGNPASFNVLTSPVRDDATTMEFLTLSAAPYFSATLTSAVWCLSAYVWIPTAYDGTQTIRVEGEAGFAGATVNTTTYRDANLSLRDQWQRIWMTFTPDAGDLNGTPRIIVTGGVAPSAGNQSIYITDWQLEQASAPTSHCNGALGTGYSWSGTAHASTSTRVSTKVQVPDAAEIQDVFDGGGAVAALVYATGDEQDIGIIASKNRWGLSWNAGRVRFTCAFSGGTGGWQLSSPLSEDVAYAVILLFNSDSASNDPTIRVANLSTGVVTTHTVGSGITEYAAPSGTRTSDVGDVLVFGNASSGGYAFGGRIDEAAVFNGAQPTLAQFSAWTARCMDAPRHLDEGKTTLSWWWLDDADAMSAVVELLHTEGPDAAIYEDGTGAIVFKNRHARVLEARSTDIQTTLRSSGTEPVLDLPFRYDPGIKDVVNDCTVEVKTRAAQSLAQVWALGSTVTLGPSESRSYTARQSDGDPFTAAVTPTAGAGDYTVSAGSLSSVSLDRTSGARVTVTLTAGASGATVTGLRLRAQSVEVTNTTVVQSRVDASASRAQYGVRSFRFPVRAEIDIDVAQDFCDAQVGRGKDGRPTATVALLANGDAARMTAALAREIGDRVRVIEDNVVLDDEFFVEAVRHDVSAPATHRTVFDLSLAIAEEPGVWDEALWDSGLWWF